MLTADSLIGFYDWRVAIVVYVALLLPVVGGCGCDFARTIPDRWAAGILWVFRSGGSQLLPDGDRRRCYFDIVDGPRTERAQIDVTLR